MAAERAALRQALNELVRLKGGADNPTRFLALLDRSALCEWAKRLGGISTSSTGSSTREGKLDAAAPRGPPARHAVETRLMRRQCGPNCQERVPFHQASCSECAMLADNGSEGDETCPRVYRRDRLRLRCDGPVGSHDPHHDLRRRSRDRGRAGRSRAAHRPDDLRPLRTGFELLRASGDDPAGVGENGGHSPVPGRWPMPLDRYRQRAVRTRVRCAAHPQTGRRPPWVEQ